MRCVLVLVLVLVLCPIQHWRPCSILNHLLTVRSCSSKSCQHQHWRAGHKQACVPRAAGGGGASSSRAHD